jgi:hypothetical protein
MKSLELSSAEKGVIAKVRSYYPEPGGCRLEHLTDDEENVAISLVARGLLRQTARGSFRTTPKLRTAEQADPPTPQVSHTWTPAPVIIAGVLVRSVPSTCVAAGLSYETPRTAEEVRAIFAATYGEGCAAQIGWEGTLAALVETGWVCKEGTGYLLTGAQARPVLRP